MLKFKICVKTGVFTCFETIFKLVNERTQDSVGPCVEIGLPCAFFGKSDSYRFSTREIYAV